MREDHVDDDANEIEDEAIKDNPEGLIAYGVWHKVSRVDGQIVLIETVMTQFRNEPYDEDEEEEEILSLDDLSQSWALAAAAQGAHLEEGEWEYFSYPESGDVEITEDSES